MAPTSMRTFRALVVCLLAAVATLASPARSAQAWSDGACADGEGVTVVVDFRSLGGDTIVRCAAAPVESGYDALTRAGLDWTPTQRHPGFLCRIEGVPADDPCVNTPPADAYWSYWRAEPGGEWAYSNYGPGTTSPSPGPVEGWSFSTGTDDQAPRTAPPGSASPEPPPSPPSPEPPPPSPSPSPSPSPTADPGPDPSPTAAPPTAAAPGPAASPGPTSTSDAGPTNPEARPTDDEPSTREVTGSPSPTATRSASPSPPPAATPTPTPSSRTTDAVATAGTAAGGDGPGLGTLAGIVLVVGVAGGAVVADRRRRRP